MDLSPFKSSLEDLLKKYGKELAADMIGLIVFPALEQAVKDSSSPIDDVVLAALEAPLKQAALDALAKL